MLFKEARGELAAASSKARMLFDETKIKPRVRSLSNLKIFIENIRYSFRLIGEEKEILFFAALQWGVIAIGYLLWVQALDWIPDEIWEAARKYSDKDGEGAFQLMNLLLFCWSLVVIVAAAYPLSVLNTCIANVHLLRHSNQESTVQKCLQYAFRNTGKVWVYTSIDAYITCNAILDRLPKRGGNKRTATDELLYYAWKIGTMGAAISLMYGNGFIQATRDSITLLKEQTLQAIGLRMGYSLICWIVGILAYIGAIFFYGFFGNNGAENQIYNFYLLMAFPIVFSVGVISVLIRPLYLIALANLYTQTIAVEQLPQEQNEQQSLPVLTLCIFAVLLGGILGAILAGESLGLQEWIDSLAAKDLEQLSAQ